jgi:predicted dehydrogenase
MLKIGVLGAGHLGKIHIKCIQETEVYELVGFYDPDDANSAQVGKDFQINHYADIESLIKDVDVVDIVTPTISHFECAALALRNFKHVFIEKPVVTSPEEAKQLIDLAGEAGVKVQVGHVERFNPAFTAAQPYFEQPVFVETHRLALFNPRGTDVPVILDLMIHDIDIVLSVVKSNIKKIHASGVAVVSETPDIANARLEFDNGCVANLTASRISMKNMRKSRFFQKDAYISVDFLDKKAEILKLKSLKKDEDVDPLAMVIDLGEGKGSKQIIFDKPDVQPINAIKTELETFADAILNNTTPKVTIEDGYAALDVAHKIMEKMKSSLNDI